MPKEGLSPARLAVIVLFSFSVFGLLLFLWLSFGGSIPLKPKGYRLQVSFPEAATLAEQADVRVAGVSIGKVVHKERDPNGNRTLATLELQNRYAPLRADSRAILRQKTLLGETYVELTTGTKGAKSIPEGGRLGNGQVEPTVELDELLEIFEPRTRSAFRVWQRELARATAGRGQDLNDAFGNLPGFAASGTSLLEVLDRRAAAVRSQISNTGVTFEALTSDESALQRAIVSTRVVFDAIAVQREDLAEAIRIFPTFLDESKATLARLQTFARATDPLLVDLKPTLVDLKPTLASLQQLSPDLQKLFTDLDPLIDASVQGLPATDEVVKGVKPVLREIGPFLQELVPILKWLRRNNLLVGDFLSVGPSTLANREPTPNPNGRGHVLPQMIVIGDQTILTLQRTASNRGNTYLEPGAYAKPRWERQEILVNWDCKPSDGPLPPGQGEPHAGFGGRPACFVQNPIQFQGADDRFPHVTRKNYRNADD